MLEGALELDVFIAQTAAFDGERNLRDEFVVGPRLGDVVLRAAFECRASHINRTKGGDEDDGELRIAAANFAEELRGRCDRAG